MLLVGNVLGTRADPAMSERLHHIEHHGRVDILIVPAADLARRRFRATTESGEEIAVALPRDQKLFDGAILLLEHSKAIVVRVDSETWLRLQPASTADALELGYHAGNLHWRVRFEGEALLVSLDAPMERYLERLGQLVTERRVTASVVQGD